MNQILDPHRRLNTRAGQLCQVTKVLTCGCMIGTAVLFPLANVEAPWFRFATLSIFIITTLSFTAIHVEPFVRYGPFTLPVALLILLLAVLHPGSPRRELIPWLPLFIASSSLVTVAIYEFSQRFKIRQRLPSPEDGHSDYSIGSLSGSSTRVGAFSDGRSSRRPSEPDNSLLYGQHGPSSHYSHRSGDSDLTLSSVPGRVRLHWDSATQDFFQAETSRPGPPNPGREHPETSQEYTRYEPDMDLASENATTRSDQALLNSQR